METQTNSKPLLLDTNFQWGWFENAIKAYRRNPEDYEKGRFDPTKKMEFLVEAKYEVFTPDVAQSEVFRKLFSEKNVEVWLCKRTWEDFISSFSIAVLKVIEVDFSEIAEMCLMAKLGKGSIPNLVQLQFAKNNNLPFATGDDAIKENYTSYYERVYTYIELRKLFGAEKPEQ